MQLNQVRGDNRCTPRVPRTHWRVSQRKAEVLDLIARGYTNAEIAGELGISLDGAKWHVGEVLGILGFESRAEAARWWRRRYEFGSAVAA